MKNLAQMDGVSKMVIAMLGGKNLEFLTPKKVQQIKTDLAGYKVNIAIYEGQKVYSVKDAKGKETVLATPEELFMFILDKEASKKSRFVFLDFYFHYFISIVSFSLINSS